MHSPANSADGLELEVRARLDPRKSARWKHECLLRGLRDLTTGQRLSVDLSKIGVPEDPIKSECDSVSLTRALPSGISGYVLYTNRVRLQDDAVNDDHVIIKFRRRHVDLGQWLKVIFPAFVRCFDAYYGAILNREDSSSVYERHPWDPRWTVGYLGLVNYFDTQLCQRAFRMSPAQLIERWSTEFVMAKVYRKGALLMLEKSTEADANFATHADALLRRMLSENAK